MDHRISKDMISSGMIPSGEKKKEDLGRPQYGTAPSPNALADAYKSMYEHHKKDADGNTIPHEGEELNEEPITAALIGGAKLLGGKALAGAAGKGLTAGASKLATRAAIKVGGKSAGKMVKGGLDAFGKMDNLQKFQTYQMGKDALNTAKGAVNALKPQGVQKNKGTNTISADADLFDIVKGQLLDEGLSEEEIKDIMLTLTPDEILKEIEESSMSAGEGADRHMGTDDVARTKQQIGNMFNKNVPKKENTGGKVDKMTRKSINTSARDLGIQGPTTLKQSVEPKGNTI